MPTTEELSSQNQSYSGKILPHSLEGENYIIGSLLVGDINTWDTVMDILQESDFYKPAHQAIFACMESLYKKGSSVDIVCVSEELKKQKKIELVGGTPYLAELAEQSTSTG